MSKKKDISRRDFLTKTGGCSLALLSCPAIIANRRPTLRVLGTHVTLQEQLRKMAMKDLGINLEFEPKGSAAVLQKAASNPSSFDLYEQWSDSINILWQAKSIQSLDTKRIANWNEINSLSKTGKVSLDGKIGLGDSPHKLLYVQQDGSLGERLSDSVSFLPYVHNVDSFGYNTKFIEKGTAYETESWAWLLDDRYKGKVGIINAPTIGIFDCALAAQAAGLMKFANIGNMSITEIDQLFSILVAKKESGHFSGFWGSVPQSVDYMVDERVWLESMFSPGVSSARGKGVKVTYASPKEGYRAWQGVLCLSSKTNGQIKDVAYEYLNWWLSGQPGAFIARQGYYISNPQRSRPFMKVSEWDYWYEGKAASEDLRGTDGKISVYKGELRDGGSYLKRFSNIAVWNTVMDNYDYSLEKWYEFLNS
ncbi:PotD/PotF family extracellular solute-binding protein [Halobacteriovorax sp. HLS]|uniref:ABC transporter substrate-binding protein n=1 Tax=Halobacteriovorax sp. HLS TaxID=2234000 RepID=UPI000FD8F947|nr:extracellular solute-binding protein [Halobacteriovorax sp. HLS]